MEFKVFEKNVSSNPTMIIGMAPGKQRKSQQSQKAFEGNASGDLIQDAIKDIDNIVLTNIIQVYTKDEISDELIESETKRLVSEIKKYKPVKIIALGAFAQKCLKRIDSIALPEIIAAKHPSYIIRFKKSKYDYKESLLNKIKK